MQAYENLIVELGNLLNIPLKSENSQTCCLRIASQQVYIELDRNADRVMLGSYLGELSASRYRTEVLQRALIANGQSSSPAGILAFSESKNCLVLFQYFFLDKIDAHKLYAYLQLFLSHAEGWRSCLASKTLPEVQPSRLAKSSGLFGLRP